MIRLDDTSGGEIASAIAAERHRQGSPTTGMVLTLLILTDEEFQSDATSSAVQAAREHPMRIITVIPRPSDRTATLNAEISVGGDDGPGEVAVLRLRGELAQHADSVVIPLLLSDTPVVVLWPCAVPQDHSTHMIGMHAQRRITDSSRAPDPIAFLLQRKEQYRAGDTDLAWTRITTWRSTLAAGLDRPLPDINSAVISASPQCPSALLLARWLGNQLAVPTQIEDSGVDGIASVALKSAQGDFTLKRIDSHNAILTRPGANPATISLPSRDLASLLAEELRQLAADQSYARVLQSLNQDRN